MKPFSTLKPQVPDTIEHSDQWRKAAVCREIDPELFFPTGTTGPALVHIEEAKAICRRCPVMETCLEWALDSREDAGVWGGRSEAERRTILRRRSRGQEDPEPKPEPRTHENVHARYIRAIEGGHSKPTSVTTAVSVHGERFSLAQLSFFLHHGRRAAGKVAAYCGHYGCLTGSHLGDPVIRAERDAAVASETDLGVSEASRFWVGSGHGPIGHKPRKVTPAGIDEIHARTLAGESHGALAIEYGVSPETIRNYAA